MENPEFRCDHRVCEDRVCEDRVCKDRVCKDRVCKDRVCNLTKSIYLYDIPTRTLYEFKVPIDFDSLL